MRVEMVRIVLSFIISLVALIFHSSMDLFSRILYIVAYLIVGYDTILGAMKNLVKGKVLDECFLMSIATIGAFLIGEFPEAVAIMLFYRIGELFQDYAVDKSRKSVANLMDIRPDYANLLKKDKIKRVSPDEVKVGDTIVVKPGEKIPLDGIVIEGESFLNTLALTGESVPRKVMVGTPVLSGCINQEGTLKIETTKEFGESTVSKILDLVEHASECKAKSENFIHKFAKYYTPTVVGTSLLLATIPPLILHTSFSPWIYRALSFLVVSCPCALVISIPLSFFGGIGAASKQGILIKGGNYLEALGNSEIVVFDKTGTLTEGVFKVQKIEPVEEEEKEVLRYAAYAESFSNHPIALSLREAYGKKINQKSVTRTKEISGKGVYAKVDGKDIYVGNDKLLKSIKISVPSNKEVETVVYVVIDNKYAGMILIADQVKKDSKQAMISLRNHGVKKIVMLTGDLEPISKDVASKLRLDEYYAELLPQDKVSMVEQLKLEKSAKGKLIFVGDGINDAPVLALSDVGVAMGGLGSDAAIEAADVVIMNDEPSKLAEAIQISKRTMRIVRENIIFAIAVKIMILGFSAFGLASMWAAVFADVGVSVLAVCNALRLLKTKKELNSCYNKLL